ncbi:MAG: hypothetical protein K0R55_4412 [Sporomusa sp.]|jgi:TPR repeat protein|nr:hypothetical protein [Sporomusa sp.]
MRNHYKAFNVLAKRLKKGFATAQFHLAECYLLGLGTTKSETDAFTYYSKAIFSGI